MKCESSTLKYDHEVLVYGKSHTRRVKGIYIRLQSKEEEEKQSEARHHLMTHDPVVLPSINHLSMPIPLIPSHSTCHYTH
jgi:hypothetical protein